MDAGFLYRLDPLIEECRAAFPSQGGVASSADVQVAVEGTVLDRAGVLDDRREPESRSHRLERGSRRQQFHHRRRRYHMVLAVGVNHFPGRHVLHKDGHIRLPRDGVGCQEVDGE